MVFETKGSREIAGFCFEKMALKSSGSLAVVMIANHSTNFTLARSNRGRSVQIIARERVAALAKVLTGINAGGTVRSFYHIRKMRHRLQVGWIDTDRATAEMIAFESDRDIANNHQISDSIGRGFALPKAKYGIALVINLCLPVPARRPIVEVGRANGDFREETSEELLGYQDAPIGITHKNTIAIASRLFNGDEEVCYR